MTSRTVAVATLALALATTLTACGGDDGPDAADAGTHACRLYLLGGGAGDQALATNLDTLVKAMEDGNGPGYQPNVITKELVEIRGGAASGGGVAGLADKDFKLFANLASAAAAIEAAIAPDQDAEGLTSENVGALVTAVQAVHKRCD